MQPDEPTVARDARLIAGRYELGEHLGAGGFGTVYRARDTLLQRDVAIKLSTSATTPERRERFLREARATARLHHPNAVTIFDAGDDPAGLFLVLELVSGAALSQVAAAGPMPPERVAHIIKQVAQALQAAHDLGIVHRDIKPANILTLDGDRVKVADFGVARLEGDAQLTVAGVAVGTPGYMAPEQLEGGRVTPATDLFALGVLAYQLLTGNLPFRGLARGRWERPDGEVVAQAPALWRAIARLLEVEPAHRGTLAQLVEAIDGPSSLRRSHIRAAVTVLALLGLAAGGWWMSREWVKPATTVEVRVERLEGTPTAANLSAALRNYDFRKEPNRFTGSASSTRRISVRGRYAAGDFVSVVARATGWPLVQDTSVRKSGRAAVAIEASDTPWDEVVQTVISAADLNVSRIGEVWILESHRRRRERERVLSLTWRAFDLENRSDPETVAAALHPLLSERGVAAVIPPNRQVIVSDTAERVAAMHRVIDELDGAVHRKLPADEMTYDGEPILFHLHDADIADLLSTLSGETGLSIVLDPEVTGKVTVDLPHVPWDNAVEAILTSQGLTWILRGQVMQVIPEAKRFRGPTVVETLHLTRCKPSRFRVFEKALKPTVEIVVADDPSGTLVLRGSESSVKRVANEFKKIDGQSPAPRARDPRREAS